MKKARFLLTLALSSLLALSLASCGNTSTPDTPVSSKPTESSQVASEPTQTDVLYAYRSADLIKGFPIEYTGAQKNPQELADELTKLTGLDFFITATEVDGGWVVDWNTESTLVAGLDDRDQKEEFFFFEPDSLRWFMMDSLWYTLTENLGVENIYYTMSGGQELDLRDLQPVDEFPSDIPYMGSDFYYAHDDVQGEENVFLPTRGLWRLDGSTDTAFIEMDGLGYFTMYYASGAVEAVGYLECTDEEGLSYGMYAEDGSWITDLTLETSTQFSIGDGSVYQLDISVAYQGFWEYPDGTRLEIFGDRWYVYAPDESDSFAEGPVEFEADAAYLMNDDGSSGGGRIYFDEEGRLTDSDSILVYLGMGEG